jgi:ATP-dependent helicase HrpA
VTVQVPIYALNQVSDERCEWLVPGMLQGQGAGAVQEPAPAAALAPGAAARLRRRVLRQHRCPSAQGSLMDVLLKAVRDARNWPCSATTSSWSSCRRTCS